MRKQNKRMAPNYACLYMGLFENQFRIKSKILFYMRLIEDIFMIIDCTVYELMGFHEYLNSCNQHLQFTLEYNTHRICFLDIQVYKDGMSLKLIFSANPLIGMLYYMGIFFLPSRWSKVFRSVSSTECVEFVAMMLPTKHRPQT